MSKLKTQPTEVSAESHIAAVANDEQRNDAQTLVALSRDEASLLPPGGGEPHEFMMTVDALVIGRKTFETVLAFEAWPYVVAADRAEST